MTLGTSDCKQTEIALIWLLRYGTGDISIRRLPQFRILLPRPLKLLKLQRTVPEPFLTFVPNLFRGRFAAPSLSLTLRRAKR